MKKNVYLSENVNNALVEYLITNGWTIKIVSAYSEIKTGISSHPDIYMCKLGVLDEAEVFFGDRAALGEKYPADVIYNAACTGKYFIHNLKYTSPELLKLAENRGFTLINTRQGYAKCSLALIDENSVITSDEGTAKALKNAGLDVLLIEKGYVRLEGYDYGFIGGACGRVGNVMVFNGNLAAHPDYGRIESFILSKGLLLKFFPEYPLEDIGSVITEIREE